MVLMFPSAWLNLDKFLPDYSSVISLFLDNHLEKTSNCKSVFAPLRYKPPSLLITLQPRNTLYYFSTGLPQHLRTLPILISSELSSISPLALNLIKFSLPVLKWLQRKIKKWSIFQISRQSYYLLQDKGEVLSSYQRNFNLEFHL